MYSIAQKEMRLDGVITEFSDIYAPVAQLYRTQMEDAKRRKYEHYHTPNLRKTHNVGLNDENNANL